MSAGTWVVEVDRGVCLGTGVCLATAPDHLAGRDGKAFAVAATTEPSEALLDAAEMCPMAAITVTDQATGRVLAPEQ